MAYELFDLRGQCAIVTGGYSHLGKYISEVLADAGADLFIVGRNEEKCRKTAEDLQGRFPSTKIRSSQLLLESTETIEKCISDVKDVAGRIDILVNNASFNSPAKIDLLTENEWVTGVNESISGTYRVTMAAVPHMLQQRRGSIINIASMYGTVSPDPSIYQEVGFDSAPHYAAGKAAILQFTRYVACHYAKKGIRVNAISPGPFPKPEVQKNELFVSRLKEKTPMGRIGQPQEIKGAVLFLASQASSYVTGINIPVDGGWTAW